MDNSTLKKITTLKNLPTLPHILLKLIEACNRKGGSLKEVSLIVEKDPAISVKILKIVNSAYYGLPKKVENIDQAVTLVGTNPIRNIAICASVHEAFSRVKGNNTFNLKLFWWHSLKCAVLARLISKKIRYSHPDEAFLAGLLHDIGKLVLWANFLQQYENLLDVYHNQDESLLAAEENLAANHCEIGAWLLNRWNFKPFLADSVLYHHEPQNRIATALPLVQIVNAANALAREPIREKEKIFAVAKNIFQLGAAEVEELLSLSAKEAQAVALSLNIEVEPPPRPQDPVSEKDFKKKTELVEKVQDISLLFGTLQNLLVAEDQAAILEVVQQGLWLLFDIDNLVFFLYDPEKKCLVGKTAPADKRFSEIDDQIIPLEMENSLLLACIRQGKPLDTFSLPHGQSPVLMDVQIARLLNKQGMVCLPMFVHKEPVGVIVIGLDQVDFSHLSDHFTLLTLFAGQAASALQADYHRCNRLKIIQSERIRASSAIARKVCHEVNNPLGIIKNYLNILGKKLARQDMAQDEIRIINEEIDRVSCILKELSDFSKENFSVTETVDVNLLISDLAKLAGESLEKNAGIQLNLDLAPSVPAVMAEKNGLKQIFINLIKNAAEAMPKGGELMIQTRHKYIPLGQHQENHGKKFQGYVEITFSDSGTGISDQIKSRLFEPYVSSKGASHAGLGLSIVHNIVKALNGNITCENKKDKGAVFKIELPVIHEKS